MSYKQVLRQKKIRVAIVTEVNFQLTYDTKKPGLECKECHNTNRYR